MKALIAAVTWDRDLWLDSVDAASLTRFFLASAETKAPRRSADGLPAAGVGARTLDARRTAASRAPPGGESAARPRRL